MIVQKVKQPQKMMIWGCISYNGFRRIHVVEGTMNVKKYVEVLNSRMKTHAREWFGGESVYQQDNALQES